jgi:molybdopterin-guanine dinucleotide biosynthesis protein A
VSDPLLYGLVLAGGRSRRMQRDKAMLPYAGEPQLERALRLLAAEVARAFVSISAEQRADPQRARYECIVDLTPDLGPIGGIQAALTAHPECAWLILACDLPFLDASTLRHLIERRARGRIATAYRSRHDGQPEPLCAIYEPASRAPLEAAIASGRLCPRALLSQQDVELLDLLEPLALENVNTGAEYGAAVSALGRDPPPTRHLRVRYFALLREQAGRGSEELETQARTPRELYEQLCSLRGLTLGPQFLRVAINEEFGDWLTPLDEGDTVAFLPPVAGG